MEDTQKKRHDGSSSPLSSLCEDGHGQPISSLTSSSPTRNTFATAQSPTKPSIMAQGKAKIKKKIVVRRAPKKSKWTAENILTDPKSPLATADLRNLLSNPAAWDVLDAADRQEILSLFPDGEHVLEPGTGDARPDFLSLKNDDTFRHDCAAYTENLAEGRYDPEWLQCAWSAHERRKMGDFDEHLATKFEEDWQVALPDDFKPKRQPEPTQNVDQSIDRPETSGNDRASEEDPAERKEVTDPEAKEEIESTNGAEMPAGGDHPAWGTDRITKEPPQDDKNKSIDELQENPSIRKKGNNLPVMRKRRRTTKADVNETDTSEDELA